MGAPGRSQRTWFADSWREPDHYGWMVGYLRARGLATRVRLLITAATTSYVVLPLSMLASPAGPHGSWPRAAEITATGAVLLSAATIARRWPTEQYTTRVLTHTATPPEPSRT